MPNPVVLLRFFGGVAVEREGKRLGGRASQRRRLGVLTVLAAAPAGLVSRDKLLGLLWPEADTEAGRHLLAGAVYELRKALGDDAIQSRGDDLALNPDLVSSDLTAFEAALGSGDRNRAVALYKGPFADGFFVSRAPEFERWVEETRARYLDAFRRALRTLAEDREREGSLSEAADVWQRLAALDPADGPVVLRSMRAMELSGQRVLALRQSQLHAAHNRREFGGAPDPAVVALAAEIRQRHKVALPDSLLEPEPPTMPWPRTRASMARRVAIWSLAGAATLLLVAIGRNARAGGADIGEGVAAPLTEVVVRPFLTPDAKPAEQGEDIAGLLAQALSDADGIRATADGEPDLADPSSHSAYIQGQVEPSPDGMRLHARLFGLGDNPIQIAEASAVGEPNHLTETLDRLALELLRVWPRPSVERLSQVAAGSTNSLVALKAWLAGEHEFHAGRFQPASDAFARAVAADTGFAMGHYRLSQAQLAADFPEAEVSQVDRRMLETSGGLPERDRLLLRAYSRFRIGYAEYAEQRYQSLTTRYPDDLEAWLQLGETRFHYGPLRGVPLSAAGDAFRRAAALDPGNWSATWHLAHIAATEGRRKDLVEALDQLLAGQPERTQELELRALRALATGDRSAETAVTRELLDVDELLLFQITWRAAVFLKDLEGAERTARILADPARPTYAQAMGGLSLAAVELARGRYRAARAEHERLASLPGAEATVLAARVAAALLPFAPDTAEDFRALHDRAMAGLQSDDQEHLPLFRLLLGLLESASAEGEAAEARADQLDRLQLPEWAALIRADVACRRGQFDEALDHLSQQTTFGWYGKFVGSFTSFQGYARFLRAEALFRTGRLDEALGWYGSLGEYAVADLGYLGPSLMRRGQIFDRLNQPARAAEEYRRLSEVWRTADPGLRLAVDSL